LPFLSFLLKIYKNYLKTRNFADFTQKKTKVHRNPPLIITYFHLKVNSFLKKTALFDLKILLFGYKTHHFWLFF